jgi:hypothetical protein
MQKDQSEGVPSNKRESPRLCRGGIQSLTVPGLGLGILVVNRPEHDEETPKIGLGLRCAGLGLDQNGTSLLVSNDQSTIRFPASDVDGISLLSTSGARARARCGAMDSRITAARERRRLRRPGRLTYPNPPAGPGDCSFLAHAPVAY